MPGPPLIHADFISLASTATAQVRQDLIDAASALTELDSVVAIGLIEAQTDSDFDLALLFVLPDFRSLEPFGTDQRYIRFLQGRVAPALEALAGADIQLEDDLDELDEHGACLALAAPPHTYDWEVRTALETWLSQLRPASRTLGLAIGERQRFRGLAVASSSTPLASFRPTDSTFGSALVSGKVRWLSA